VIGLTFGSSLAGQAVGREKPTQRLHHDEQVKRDLDTERLGVLFASGSRSVERASALDSAAIHVLASRPTGIGEWHLLSLDSPLSSVVEIDSRIGALVQSSAVEFASPVFHGLDGGWVIVTPHVLVRFRPEQRATAEVLLPALAPAMEIVERDFANMSGVYRLGVDSRNGLEVLAWANTLSDDRRVTWAEPVWQFSARKQATPDDPGFEDLWGIHNTGQFGGVPNMDMDGDLAWEVTSGNGVKVMILDDGVQSDHPDLNWAGGQDFTSDASPNGDPYNECDAHGTKVAGCVSAVADNALGTVGIAPSAAVLGARFSISTVPCEGTGSSQSDWIVQALDWGYVAGARVSNMSYNLGSPSQAIKSKYRDTHDNGMVHFASAGNNGNPTVGYPASLPTVNAVANVRPRGQLSSSSNYGPDLSVSAPGTRIYTTDRTGSDGDDPGDYLFAGGTSLAAPYAAGVAALILAAEPSLSSSEVEDKLRCSARDLGDPGFDETYGHGFVNAYKAVFAPMGVDSDSDGTEDPCDNCPYASNWDQADGEHDGIGDVCDVCPGDWLNDIDQDGYCAEADNCPFMPNPGQEDADGDGVGDVCACVAPRFVFTGPEDGGYFGYRTRSAGDVNDDGVEDLIMGAVLNDGGAWIHSGEDGSLLYELTGEATDDSFGRSSAGLGDINGDGLDDFVVTARLNDAGGPDAGRAYVFLGRPGPFPVTIPAEDAHYNLTGVADESFGNDVTSTRDLDGDGVREILVGAWQNDLAGTDAGAAHLFSGATGALIHTWTGEAPGLRFGWGVADAGDTNDDGVTDILVSGTTSGAGLVCVYSGADHSLLYRITGEVTGDRLGRGVSGVGDLDGDGYADLIVGADRNDAGGSNAGRAYVFHGRPGPYPVEIAAQDADLILTGQELDDQFGRSVSGISDLDGNELPDLVIGASGAGVIGWGKAGRAYLYSGQTGELLRAFSGEMSGDAFGIWVNGDVDVDHDGTGDLIVGAIFNDAGGDNAGRAYVYLLDDQACSKPNNRLTNVSTRGFVGSGPEVLIGGFIIHGGPKKVLVRARGPAIVPGHLQDPTVTLRTIDGDLIAECDDWQDCGNEQDIIDAGLNIGLNSADGAFIMTLDEGAYTPIVSGVGGATGVGIVEVFDLDAPSTSQLSNISTRGFVGTGPNVLIGGFITESGPTRVLLRARGPATVPGFLQDPWMELRTISDDWILDCDDWRDCGSEQEIIDCGYHVGMRDEDAAVIVTLDDGAFTPIVRGVGGTTGVGIVEAIELPETCSGFSGPLHR
jgi:hypothetical protein